MSRTDAHLDAMLRHLGAAYYDSLHGRATQADVTRAVDTVAEHLNEGSRTTPTGAPAEPRPAADAGTGPGTCHRWARRVREVMSAFTP